MDKPMFIKGGPFIVNLAEVEYIERPAAICDREGNVTKGTRVCLRGGRSILLSDGVDDGPDHAAEFEIAFYAALARAAQPLP